MKKNSENRLILLFSKLNKFTKQNKIFEFVKKIDVNKQVKWNEP